MSLFNKKQAMLYASLTKKHAPIFVEYLGGTGTQWIDTEYVPTEKTALEITYQLTDGNTRNSWFMIAGCFKPSTQNVRFQMGFNYKTNQINAGYGARGTLIYGIDELVHTLKIDGFNQQIVFDNDIKSSSLLPGDLANNTSSVFLFTTNQAGTVAKSNVKIYGAKIYDSGAIVRNFLPCLHPETKKPAMYDSVQKKYYYNMGTDEFYVS